MHVKSLLHGTHLSNKSSQFDWIATSATNCCWDACMYNWYIFLFIFLLCPNEGTAYHFFHVLFFVKVQKLILLELCNFLPSQYRQNFPFHALIFGLLKCSVQSANSRYVNVEYVQHWYVSPRLWPCHSQRKRTMLSTAGCWEELTITFPIEECRLQVVVQLLKCYMNCSKAFSWAVWQHACNFNFFDNLSEAVFTSVFRRPWGNSNAPTGYMNTFLRFTIVAACQIGPPFVSTGCPAISVWVTLSLSAWVVLSLFVCKRRSQFVSCCEHISVLPPVCVHCYPSVCQC